jgi:sulfite oxidase
VLIILPIACVTISQHFAFILDFNTYRDPAGDVILAYEMNGKPLSRDHGFPLRVIVPGFIGARSVKYLQKILIQPQESKSFFQRHDYKILPPWVNHDNVDQSWDTAASLTEMNIQCVICTPTEQQVVASSKPVTIKGYAIAGNAFSFPLRKKKKKRKRK